jgi:hypothetical protein
MFWIAIMIVAIDAPTTIPVPTPAPRYHLCWIENVSAIDDGLSVKFRDRLQIIKNRDEVTWRFIIDKDIEREFVDKDKSRHVKSVSAVYGDQLRVQGIPDGGCTANVVRENGILGIRAESVQYSQGKGLQKSTEFISIGD